MTIHDIIHLDDCATTKIELPPFSRDQGADVSIKIRACVDVDYRLYFSVVDVRDALGVADIDDLSPLDQFQIVLMSPATRRENTYCTLGGIFNIIYTSPDARVCMSTAWRLAEWADDAVASVIKGNASCRSGF